MMYVWAIAALTCLVIQALKTWRLLIIPALVLLHLAVAPYTKVEESFNIQAIHDILKYGIPTSNVTLRFKALYDHMTFPGAVPRTFVGALVVAGLSKPLLLIEGIDGTTTQMIVRGTLGLLNAAALITYISSVRKAYGPQTAAWYTLFQASQFHVFFYASRTLPNMFAFCLSTFALSSFLPNPHAEPGNAGRASRLRRTFYLLTSAAVIFRSELVLLIASLGGYLILKSGSIENMIWLIRKVFLPAIITAGVTSVVISVPIDTYFWQSDHFLLPELTSFWFNIFPKGHQGASAWGTSPWHWYFTSAIPRLISPPTLLIIPYGLLFTTQRTSILDALVPALGYTTAYSILPHKETRFLFPITPSLTLATAIPAAYLGLRRDTISKVLVSLLTVSAVIGGMISHLVLLPLSVQSYPSGAALEALHSYHRHRHHHYNNSASTTISNYGPKPTINVHLTNLALQSGITRFVCQPNDNSTTVWTYDKTPTTTETTPATFWAQFDYLVIEPSQLNELTTRSDTSHWVTVVSIPALSRSRPRILNPDTARGCLVLSACAAGKKQSSTDRLYLLLGKMYGTEVAVVYGFANDVLREGVGVGRSLTRGFWVDWGMEESLVVLKQEERQQQQQRRQTIGDSGPWDGVKPLVETWM